MLRKACTSHLRLLCLSRLPVSSFSSKSAISSGLPNAPIDLDPSLKALLKDIDISLKNDGQRASDGTFSPAPRELEAYPAEDSLIGTHESEEFVEEDDAVYHKDTRKSPAAHFGSRGIGAVVLPDELQRTITTLIAESDKTTLHSDAKRLFYEPEGRGEVEKRWDPEYDVKYRSRRQASRHSERDGTAFASVALPAHYSAICAVLDHLKLRLGPDYQIKRVVEWGAGAGSGFWASLHSFQKSREGTEDEDGPKLSTSDVITYTGIDKREGLVSIGKKLLRDIDLGAVSATWQKSLQDQDKIRRSEGHDSLALSAFLLSSLSPPLARKKLVKEMWESGASTIVLIDHSSTAGFENIAEAREYILEMGRKELDDPETAEWPVRGAHVVAPCPHDGTCPLYHPGSSKLICGFSQRLQRPAFVRLTKHSGLGHEDIGYSYVVIRRGVRPESSSMKLGRIGAVGQNELEKAALLPTRKELEINSDNEASVITDSSLMSPLSDTTEVVDESMVDLEAALRQEAYRWPRLVFPPLKKSGHIILDACTPEEKIMRLTIPKSQGKQPYYDARKSSWGDIFPHEPKNTPQVRYQPPRAKREGGMNPIKGTDIGKRSSKAKVRNTSYSSLSDELKEKRKKTRRDRIHARDAQDI
ncbi:hypothetical protein SERLA73DRAFT_174300 [Serpula lacrymans var. lacrymans S7.3]|uniref:Rsm22-domain-containing protein n=2 Tax=Serpula lacrymans var. lacrymans TaxID=341189 RepID=F8PF55_SERL3|nr:uncharacterized protein SERLADRAFT_455770 [Serpula lacrymans var. lacrymans S7.9]EGO05247.1 hypothetical protein SERLA73DRAFT_174300 [Serpula lacrymans var. lacrymans S7.3]EGO31101.1 hypothetical protein SERLADRAFT_455770 [Serpula lacrymans var. lacrymans S7.9]